MRTSIVAHAASLIVSLVVSLACGGCSVLAPQDVSLLTGEPCEPPCWQGLVPGASTEGEIERFLTSSGLVNRSSIHRGRLSRGGETVGVSIQWLSTANTQGAHARNSFDLEGGILQDMTIYMDTQVTLEELFGRYGPPDRYVAAASGIHLTEARVTLFYPEHGFTARVELPWHDASLRPDTNVASVWYFKSASLDRFLELGREIGHFSASLQPEALSHWEGYGPVEAE